MLDEQSKKEYFIVQEDTAETIDITYSIREMNISNIARLYDDELPCSYNESHQMAEAVIFVM